MNYVNAAQARRRHDIARLATDRGDSNCLQSQAGMVGDNGWALVPRLAWLAVVGLVMACFWPVARKLSRHMDRHFKGRS